ncbi:MAG: UDP-N-acetylmuramate--L-alanine ligase, partial [Actinobacteria bacterium]|nr:UDP-N-acetylmuramate--L-alanine ligase [Actinomycetota bacterium]
MGGAVPFDRVELDLLGEPLRIHLLGIGGAGMSAIAEVLRSLGHVVSGSDRADSPAVQALRSHGIRVEIGHAAQNLGDAQFVGVSTAVKPDNPEVVAARSAGLAVMHRFDLLKAIGATRSTLSVSGTHGKTTTSALLALALDAADADPSFIIGSSVVGLGGGSRWSDGPWLVLEADESDSTFLAPPRRGGIVTNIEPDHLDHHGTWDDLVAAFTAFATGTDGPVIVCADDPGSALLIGSGANVVTYGTVDTADVVISGERSRDGGTAWT